MAAAEATHFDAHCRRGRRGGLTADGASSRPIDSGYLETPFSTTFLRTTGHGRCQHSLSAFLGRSRAQQRSTATPRPWLPVVSRWHGPHGPCHGGRPRMPCWRLPATQQRQELLQGPILPADSGPCRQRRSSDRPSDQVYRCAVWQSNGQGQLYQKVIWPYPAPHCYPSRQICAGWPEG